MSNCLHEMSFPQSSIAVDEKGVVNFSRSLSDGVSSSSCELIGFADDEMVEGVSIA